MLEGLIVSGPEGQMHISTVERLTPMGPYLWGPELRLLLLQMEFHKRSNFIQSILLKIISPAHNGNHYLLNNKWISDVMGSVTFVSPFSIFPWRNNSPSVKEMAADSFIFMCNNFSLWGNPGEVKWVQFWSPSWWEPNTHFIEATVMWWSWFLRSWKFSPSGLGQALIKFSTWRFKGERV